MYSTKTELLISQMNFFLLTSQVLVEKRGETEQLQGDKELPMIDFIQKMFRKWLRSIPVLFDTLASGEIFFCSM